MKYNSFRKSKTVEERLIESASIRKKFPDRIPIILEKYNDSAPDLEKYKYLVNSDDTLSILLYHIRTRIKLDSTKAIFLTIKNEICNPCQSLYKLYEDKKDDDGFLYITYTTENTFG